MEFKPSTRGYAAAGSSPVAVGDPGSGCGAAVCVPVVDVAGLSHSEIRARLGEVRRAESALAAFKARLLAGLSERCGEGIARQAAAEELGASRGQARRELQDAEQLSQATETSEALSAGAIPIGHARLLAKAVSDGPVDERAMVTAAESQDYEQFARTLREHQQEQSGDDGQGQLDRQRNKRNVRLKQGADGMYEFFGRFDFIAGNRIDAALAAKERSLRNGQENDNRTFGQRLADAAEELICAEPEGRKPQGTTLILTADWDHTAQQLANAKLLDETPLPGREALRLACDANILPAVFDNGFRQLHLGHKRRSATDAQRAALILRDRHCIGCAKSAVWCEAHHIVPWLNNGPTDIDNLVLVCTACHHDIHDRKWQVWKNPETGRYKLKPTLNPEPFPDQDPRPTRNVGAETLHDHSQPFPDQDPRPTRNVGAETLHDHSQPFPDQDPRPTRNVGAGTLDDHSEPFPDQDPRPTQNGQSQICAQQSETAAQPRKQPREEAPPGASPDPLGDAQQELLLAISPSQ